MVKIQRYQHGEGDFWQRMGPFLVNSTVRRELGIPISSDEATSWWLAVDGERTLGFCAAHLSGDVVHLRHAYVVPEARKGHLYRRLFEARLAAYDGKPMRATVNSHSIVMFQKYGFVASGTRGRYTFMERGV